MAEHFKLMRSFSDYDRSPSDIFDPELPFDKFPVLPRDIDYLFLTHAHIDHIGRVPDLIDAGFREGIIGIIAGAIAILEKVFGIFGGRKRKHKKIFKDEFGKWWIAVLRNEAKNQDSMKAPINRIKNDTLKNFLLEQDKIGDQKMSQHAAEVLRQTEQAHLTFSR